MSDFVRLPLQKKFNRRNIISRLERVERGEHTATPSSRVANLAELAKEIIGARFIAVGDDGTIRMVMSGSELLDLGVAAHLAGFNPAGTPQFYVDADDGSIVAGAGTVSIDTRGIVITNAAPSFVFLDTAGNDDTMYINGTSDNDLEIRNNTANGAVVLAVEEAASGLSKLLGIYENSGVPGLIDVAIDAGTAGTRIITGGNIIFGGADGATVFNDDSFDIDFRIESATNVNAFKLDAGAETISMLGDVIVDGGTEHRLEIGADHYFPTRNASNPNGFWNEANQDMDFTFEGTTDETLLTLDAGLNAIGIGTSSSSDYKVRIAGTVKVQNLRTRATTLADDTAVNITPSEPDGIMNIYTQGANDWAVVRYNTATPSNVSIEVGSNTNVTTGVLAGTTGTDTKFTVSCSTDGDIYVENRTGSSRSVYVLLI